ncbi:glycosyltransferase family 2 protein [Flavobacterium sp. F-65]|uniref:Glycosyltransferase family 2 protein n=1 Tax=Flavobacterium pisciphilum TaxID=2893755 RepID=A0ABS8MYU0_9FLAO|nr:glycosyltransferase family 2 protein [Flavobacterium sp. F-65]MCC9073934.1 glycosyltransferase family 2 protein [Flavobacterium sp. F-65]
MSQNVVVPKISVLAFCFNEENNIKKLIENVSFANEIILIDDKSTDQTVTIAKELGATVIEQTTTDKTQQQNLAINQAKNDWILLLNTNEYLSPELKDEILIKTSNPQGNKLYHIKQTLFFFKKKIKHGEFNNKKRIFIFDKKRHSFSDDVKKEADLTFLKKSSTLKNRIDSYAYKSFDEYNHQLSLLSKKEALELYAKNVKPNFYHFLMKPFFSFINQYFIKLGFLDGKEGYILAYINSFAVLKRYLTLWLAHNKME